MPVSLPEEEENKNDEAGASTNAASLATNNDLEAQIAKIKAEMDALNKKPEVVLEKNETEDDKKEMQERLSNDSEEEPKNGLIECGFAKE